MKKIKKSCLCLTFLLGLPLFAGCSTKITSCTLEEFIASIQDAKNYTYEYKFTPTEGYSFEYKDRFTDYGMYSSIVKDDAPGAIEFGYLLNDEDGAFSYVIENDEVKPGRAIRDENGEKTTTYEQYIKALDDLTVDNVEYKIFESNTTYRITNVSAISTILEATMLNYDLVLPHFKNIVIDTTNSKKVKITGDFGKDGGFEGYVTDIGKTTLPLGKKYLDDGKGAYVKTTIDPDYQTIIDKFYSNNYQCPLMENAGSVMLQTGIKKFYETQYNGTTAKVYFKDFDADWQIDNGLIELHEGDYDGVYKFVYGTKEQFEQLEIEIMPNKGDTEETKYFEIIGKQQLNGKGVNNFDEILIFPTSLYMFNSEKLLMDYNDTLKGYITNDYVVSVQTCAYFGYQHTISFAKPYYAAVAKTNDPELGEAISIVYAWNQDGDLGSAFLPFYNFGKVELPFVDEFMEATYA